MKHFAASVEPLDKIRRFAEEFAFDFPLLSDPTRQAAKAYGVVADDRSFASRWTFYIGVDGRILHVDRQVSPANAGKVVAEHLAQLGVPRRGRP